MMSAVDMAAFYRNQGASEATIAQVLASAGYGSALGGPLAGPGSSLDTWLAPPPPTTQAYLSPAVIPAIAGALLTALRAIISAFGIKQVVIALLSLVGVQLFKEVLSDQGQGVLEGGLATMIPGQQEFLGEWPAGLGQIEGRLVRKWTAGGSRTYFAMYEQPRQHGSHIQYYAWSPKKQAWLPYSYRRNIVFGGKELDIAAALGGRKRIGKKRALRALAGRYGGTKK
jgi:hypothetical protein